MKDQEHSETGVSRIIRRLFDSISRNPLRWAWVLFSLFVLSRALSLTAFPIFNDEALYLQYSQLIHQDFGTFKFISVDNVFHDWKPPLQYWLGSLFINLFDNPLVSGRVLSLLVSLVGFWGIYLFVFRLYGPRPAVGSLLVWLLCPPTFMYNNQFVAETYVFSIAAVYFSLLLSGLESRSRGRQIFLLAGAAVTGSLLFLTKQSGALYLYLSPLIAFLPDAGPKRTYTRQIIIRIGLVLVTTVFAFALYHMVIPGRYFAIEKQFTGRWTLSMQEMLELPLKTWQKNIGIVGRFYSSYYTLFIIPLLLWFGLRAFIRRNRKDIVISLMFLGGSAAVLFGLKNFHEYIYHTAIAVFLAAILGKTLVDILESMRGRTPPFTLRLLAAGTGICALVMFGSWVYQDTLMASDPGRYIRRSTPWMRGGYLESWATGFGVDKVMGFLANTEGPGIAFLDPQWGNPGVSIVVFHDRYPNVEVMTLDKIGDPEVQKALGQFTNRFVIFSDSGGGSREEWRTLVKENACDEETRIVVEEGQAPIVICSF